MDEPNDPRPAPRRGLWVSLGLAALATVVTCAGYAWATLRDSRANWKRQIDLTCASDLMTYYAARVPMKTQDGRVEDPSALEAHLRRGLDELLGRPSDYAVRDLERFPIGDLSEDLPLMACFRHEDRLHILDTTGAVTSLLHSTLDLRGIRVRNLADLDAGPDSLIRELRTLRRER